MYMKPLSFDQLYVGRQFTYRYDDTGRASCVVVSYGYEETWNKGEMTPKYWVSFVETETYHMEKKELDDHDAPEADWYAGDPCRHDFEPDRFFEIVIKDGMPVLSWENV